LVCRLTPKLLSQAAAHRREITAQIPRSANPPQRYSRGDRSNTPDTSRKNLVMYFIEGLLMARQKIPREEVCLPRWHNLLDQEGREFERFVGRLHCIIVGIEKINDLFAVDQYEATLLRQQFRQLRVVGLDFLFKMLTHAASS
jgi:hypothetical protein